MERGGQLFLIGDVQTSQGDVGFKMAFPGRLGGSAGGVFQGCEFEPCSGPAAYLKKYFKK